MATEEELECLLVLDCPTHICNRFDTPKPCPCGDSSCEHVEVKLRCDAHFAGECPVSADTRARAEGLLIPEMVTREDDVVLDIPPEVEAFVAELESRGIDICLNVHYTTLGMGDERCSVAIVDRVSPGHWATAPGHGCGYV